MVAIPEPSVLLQSVREVVSPNSETEAVDTGTHVVGRLSRRVSDREMAARIATAGLWEMLLLTSKT